MLEGIKACLFDMDGTIIDSNWVWHDIDVEFLSKRGCDMPDNLQKDINGKNFNETAIYFKERFGLTESIEEIKAVWNHMAMDAYTTKVKLKPGVREYFEYLKGKGILLGIATSNSTELAYGNLKANGIFDCFDVIFTGNDVKKGKPAPDIYLMCAKALEVSPQECLVFEDIMFGIQAGHNAGMKVCAVYDDFSKDIDDEKRKESDYYISDYFEIIGD